MKILLSIVVLSVALGSAAYAESPEEKGLAIAREVDSRDRGWKDQRANLVTMVVEYYPAYENSGYTRQVVWIDSEIMQIVRTEFYDRKNALLKTLTIGDYRRYADRFWRAGVMRMENNQTGKSTEIRWSDYEFGTGLGDRDFNKNALKRAR